MKEEIMRRLLVALIAVSISIAASHRAFAGTEKLNLPELGIQLEEQMWSYMKLKNWAEIEKKISDIFLSVHKDGARDKAAEMTLIKKLDIGNFRLSDYKVVGEGDIIVVTYMAVVDETLLGIRTRAKPTPRQSVWQKTADGWKWIAHSNLYSY
jgi:hypothetical protein